LFQNANAAVAVWQMNGADVVAYSPIIGNPGPSLQVVGTGNFYGVGHSDILFQNTNGAVAIWRMNGADLIEYSPVIGNPGPSWRAIGTRRVIGAQ
jgi:hypothetical protein